MRLRFEIHGETQIDRELVAFQEFGADASPAFEIIYRFLLKIEEQQFASEGGYSGNPWPALAESTVKAKQRLKLRPEILRATDALLHSLTQEGDRDQLKEITPSSLAFGSTLPYAVYHQSGTGTMPQRRPMDLTEDNKRSIVKSLQLWLRRGIAPDIR